MPKHNTAAEQSAAYGMRVLPDCFQITEREGTGWGAWRGWVGVGRERERGVECSESCRGERAGVEVFCVEGRKGEGLWRAGWEGRGLLCLEGRGAGTGGYSRRTVGAEAWNFFLLFSPSLSFSSSSSSFFFFFFFGGGGGVCVTLNKCGQVSLSYLVRTPLCLLGALSGVGLLIWFSAHSVLSLVVIVCRVNLLSSFPPAPTAPADQSKCCKPLRKIACSCHGKYYKNFS